MTDVESVFDEMIEFGLSVETAERLAPPLAAVLNDPRGPRQALIEDEPKLAARLGWAHIQ